VNVYLHDAMKIGLLDHMGYGNLGDAATQEALIANIKSRLPKTDIVGFSLNPHDTRKRHDIGCHSITHWHPGLIVPGSTSADGTDLQTRLKSTLKALPVVSGIIKRLLYLLREVVHLGRSFKVLRSLDVLIIAGGGQLSELWRGPWSHPYNLFKFCVLTKLANRQLLFLNVGAGPLNSRLSKVFVKYSVDLADYVSLRDIESQALIQRLGTKRKTHVFPDSVYALDVSNYGTSNDARKSKPLVGINPIGFCDPRIWPKQDEVAYSRYLDNLTEFLLWLVDHNYSFKVFSGEASVDLYAIEDLRRRLLNRSPPADCDGMFASPSENLNDLLTEMSRFDFVITSKFHGVVFSHLLEKPVIALSYHLKIDDLMRTAGHSQHCLGIESFSCELLQKAFKSLVEDAQDLKSQFREGASSNSRLLKAQFDELFKPKDLEHSSRVLEPGKESCC
jgi:polysaccharide pyruvyl transferase WcaK-like protein